MFLLKIFPIANKFIKVKIIIFFQIILGKIYIIGLLSLSFFLFSSIFYSWIYCSFFYKSLIVKNIIIIKNKMGLNFSILNFFINFINYRRNLELFFYLFNFYIITKFYWKIYINSSSHFFYLQIHNFNAQINLYS